jgi:hypothetical protein
VRACAPASLTLTVSTPTLPLTWQDLLDPHEDYEDVVVEFGLLGRRAAENDWGPAFPAGLDTGGVCESNKADVLIDISLGAHSQ